MAEELTRTRQSSPSIPVLTKNAMDFVTVVTVGSEDALQQNQDISDFKAEDENSSGYVTVLTIGELDDKPQEIIEEVLVYRLPGERLGFGLKFEGGTKAAEFVKRLFIQSCAPDSPASMVHCSWGKLTEGDEVLNIDSLPVTSMTRIDCVRCLKDSNVVIKLLVRHFVNKPSDDAEDSGDSSARLTEDLPLVIGAEKKRTPPPPPPVPPRKIPRKMLKDPSLVAANALSVTETDSTPVHPNNEPIINGTRNNRFQSPRNSGRFAHSRQSPEVARHVYRDRRLSDGSLGPPDAEVYLDLFSQEPGCNLSESDDTGSSISTIIDRFSSFPTTTNSSFAGSLPSTPTFIQKQLDVLCPLDKSELDAISNDNYLFTKLVSSQNGIDELDTSNSLKTDSEMSSDKLNKNNEVVNEDGTPLQPPTNFQDAPLSYGNEDVGVVEASLKTSARENISKYIHQCIKNISEIEDENGNCLKDLNIDKTEHKVQEVAYFRTNGNETRKRPPPPPPPTNKPPASSRDENDSANGGMNHTEPINGLDLPRLVHFVPKCNTSLSTCENQENERAYTTIESVKMFLENEIRTSKEALLAGEKDVLEDDNIDCISDSSRPEIYNSELYNLTWSLAPQLATIGEDDEEGCQDALSQKSATTCTPIVIIENADIDRKETENIQVPERSDAPDGAGNACLYDADKSDIDGDLQSFDAVSDEFSETMDAPPSSSRQPPDGDEFPDYHEVPVTPKQANIEEPPSKPPLTWINNNLWKNNSTFSLFRDQQSSCSVRDKIAIFSNGSSTTAASNNFKKVYKSTDDIFTAAEKERLDKKNAFSDVASSLNKVKRSASTSCKTVTDPVFLVKEKMVNNANTLVAGRARSSLDLTFETSNSCFSSHENYDDIMETHSPPQRLHTRSQSLMDVSSTNQDLKKDRWNMLAEQRRKSLSRLKGLIIPERVIEVDVPTVIDLPEIKSNNVPSDISDSPTTSLTLSTEPSSFACQRNIQIPCLTTPPWSNNTSNVPKYSPAFKRKSLQVHSATSSKTECNGGDASVLKANNNSLAIFESETTLPKLNQKEFLQKSLAQSYLYDANQDSKTSASLCLSDAPKSLESITSPTRSDCSFEYVSSSPDIKHNKRESSNKPCQLDTKMELNALHRGREDIGKSEDESDNDSAVSSSQSSYISRTSPPTSPSHLHSNFTSRTCSINESDSLVLLKCHSTGSQPHSQSGDNQNHRLLKPQSVEAINRKNILASAKCRSGRDLKIGSPLIQRRFEEDAAAAAAAAAAVAAAAAAAAVAASSATSVTAATVSAAAEEEDASRLNVSASESHGPNIKYAEKCIIIQANNTSVNANSNEMNNETVPQKDDSLSVNSKIDCANNSSSVQRWTRTEPKRVAEREKMEEHRRVLKSVSSLTSSATVLNNILPTEKNVKTQLKLSEPLINSIEKKAPISKRLTKDVRAASVSDLRKSFEKLAPVQTTISSTTTTSTKSNSSSAIKYNHVQEHNASNTEVPPAKQEKVAVIPVCKDSATDVKENMKIIVLQPKIPGGSVGITLAGGADYESKEITVHKIRDDSSAHRDGRLQKGDAIISINGKSVEGLTHKQLVALLKEPLPEVTLVISKLKESAASSDTLIAKNNSPPCPVSPKEKEKVKRPSSQKPIVVSFMKDASGLGLSLEGGQDSPLGNMPLLVKKIFKGGAADKCGKLQVGDELLLVNETNVSSMSRFEAWSVLKKLPEGIAISLTIRR